MKTTLATFFFTAVFLAAQSPPSPPAPPARAARPPLARALATNQPAAALPTPPSPATPAPAGGVITINPPASAAQTVSGPMAEAATNTFNFPALDINQFLTIYAELIGRTILRPTTLPAPTITLKTQTPLTRKEALQAFDTLLAMNGITIIKIGDKFVKAVPSATAFQEAAPFSKLDPEALPESGQYDVHLVQLKYTKPSELVPILQQFSKIPNSVYAIESSQILVIRDYAENVRRMLEMIKQVDISAPAEFISEVIPIKYALASEISSALNSLGGGGGGTSVGRSTTGAGSRTGATRPTTPGYPGATGAMSGMPGTLGSQSPLGTMGTTGTPGAAQPAGSSSFTDRLRSIISKAGASGDLQILGTTKIIADERTNSLLIFATRQDMATIKEIISKLDVVLAQVLIETIIMDVSLDNTWNLGISAGQRPKGGTNNVFGGMINNGKNPLTAGIGFLNQMMQTFTTNFAGTATQQITSVITPNPNFTYPDQSGLSYFGKFAGNWDVLLNAAASDGTVNVIQKPRIQTSHAKAASLFIGSTVPYVTSTYYGGGYGGGPSSSYQQLRVGIQLTVTPFINPDGLVVMTIDESIDEIGPKPVAITGVGDVPTTVNRTLSAEVAVRDRETIILGGFIRNSDTKNTGGVPILKDIPLLGILFSSKSSENHRTELMVLMRPTVLKTPDLASMQLAEEKKHLPGISRAEAESQAHEQSLMLKEEARAAAAKQSEGRKPMSKAERELFNRITPVTPVEKKALDAGEAPPQ